VRVLRYPYAVIRDLLGGEINLRAMGLVYTTLLSLIPLLAISFAILAAFGVSRDLQPIVYEFFRPMGNPGAAEITSRVMHFVGRVSNRIVGTVGLAVLLWTLVGTIKKVEDSFNFVWRVEHARGFARRITEYVEPAHHRADIDGGLSRTLARRPRHHVGPRSHQCRTAAAPARRGDQSCAVRHGHRFLRRALHVHSEHPRAPAARARSAP
jgi:hypothetical protein